MAEPLWHKRVPATIDERIMRFLSGDDVVLDRELFVYDIRASRAHVECLRDAQILSEEERRELLLALDELALQFSAGRFVLDERYEDGHTAIETWLVEQLGDVGRRIHTGRSRNDQVLVATRLYLRDALERLERHCVDSAAAALARAATTGDEAMPGYTHMQRAVVSSVAHWYAGFAEAFIDDASLARLTAEWVDANPLGTAAGYGVNLALDRERSTAELEFRRMQVNPMYAQNSRGKFELQALAALAQALLDLRRLAWDLALYTTSEFDFVSLPERFTTGSSIMPNKRNPDLIELLRAEYARAQGASTELQALLSLPSGYQRDLQGTKGPLLRAMGRGLDALALVPELLEGIGWKRQALLGAIEAQMYATDLAIEMARERVPFREAYRRAADEAQELTDRDPLASIRERVSAGAPGNLRLELLQERLDALRASRRIGP